MTNNVGEAVRAAKQGRVDFRADKSGIVHAGLGEVNLILILHHGHNLMSLMNHQNPSDLELMTDG